MPLLSSVLLLETRCSLCGGGGGGLFKRHDRVSLFHTGGHSKGIQSDDYPSRMPLLTFSKMKSRPKEPAEEEVSGESRRPPAPSPPESSPPATEHAGARARGLHPTPPNRPFTPPPPGLGFFIRIGGLKVFPSSRAFEGPGELRAHTHPEEGSRQVPAVLANSPTERITVYF